VEMSQAVSARLLINERAERIRLLGSFIGAHE